MEPGTENASNSPSDSRGDREKDWTQAGWRHPYILYIGGTLLLFGFLILMGYLALENEWIPKR